VNRAQRRAAVEGALTDLLDAWFAFEAASVAFRKADAARRDAARPLAEVIAIGGRK